MDSQHYLGKEKEWPKSSLVWISRILMMYAPRTISTGWTHDWFHNKAGSFVLYGLCDGLQSNLDGTIRSGGHSFLYAHKHLLLQGDALWIEKFRG